jgi:hypothetical protein
VHRALAYNNAGVEIVNSAVVGSAPGVDVMITIICDFWQLSAKKLAFFSQTKVMIKILHDLALFWAENAYFYAAFFGENIF